MTILVLAEHNNSALHSATLSAVTAARAIGGELDLLVAGNHCGAVADAARSIEGLRKVLLAEADGYEHGIAEQIAPLLAELAHNYTHIIAPATSNGKDTLPRVAALLDVAQISDITAVISHDTFKRPIYAGNAIATVKAHDAINIITIRVSAFAAASLTGSQAILEIIPATAAYDRTRLISREDTVSARPELTAAKIVVSGGRGLGSKENFLFVEKLADKLGAAVGASRAAVDAGYCPNDYQVGQTGKIVAPELYIALGISGAIQHLAGMKESKVIVAVNKDETAPINEIADYWLAMDVFEAMEQLDKLLK